MLRRSKQTNISENINQILAQITRGLVELVATGATAAASSTTSKTNTKERAAASDL
jgi:hypothetical protein